MQNNIAVVNEEVLQNADLLDRRQPLSELVPASKGITLKPIAEAEERGTIESG